MKIFRLFLIRLCDIIFSIIGLFLTIPILLVTIIIIIFDTGSPLFLQERVGRYKKPFTLIKIRTMRKDTPSVASHLASPNSITSFGRFLRRSKLDELPQLWNVLIGDMSLVGPRPSLYSQTELITARQKLGIYSARPGITGLAQIRGIDMSTPQLLAETDAEMLKDLRPAKYMGYLFQTVVGAGRGDAIRPHR
jgi:O-antigen biosynthesis protein WbqP